MPPSANDPAPTVRLRELRPDDADAYRPLRLEALQDAPSAFASRYDAVPMVGYLAR